MVASDRPVEQTNRDANKRVVVTSPKGQFSNGHQVSGEVNMIQTGGAV